MAQKVILTLSVLISVGLIWGALTYSPGGDRGDSGGSFENAPGVVREENGVQYIRIVARGGYKPSQISAKADIKTILEIETQGTYDCSAALNIPQLGFQQFLPATGVTPIEIPAEYAKDSLNILCSMGMYRSRIDFN
ncbi:hypothetical protein HY604_04690 [Candidatus Peregrinibacteria bacterium]|nr:hypothetical protein [Candidatus Peregrinibacteria bacterium]